MSGFLKIVLLNLCLVISSLSYGNNEPKKLSIEDFKSGLWMDQLKEGDSIFIHHYSYSCTYSASTKIIITKVGKSYKWREIMISCWGCDTEGKVKRKRIKKKEFKVLQDFEKEVRSNRYVEPENELMNYSGARVSLTSTLNDEKIDFYPITFYNMLKILDSR